MQFLQISSRMSGITLGEIITYYLLLLVFLLLIGWAQCRYYKRRHLRVTRGFCLGMQVFFFSLSAIFAITDISDVWDALHGGYSMEGSYQVNLAPFSWSIHSSYGRLGLLLNVLLFIPVGLLIPMLWKRESHPVRTVLCGSLLSVLIECDQLLNPRTTDVDDVLMNTLGTVLGYLLYCAFVRRSTVFQLDNTESRDVLVRHGALSTILLLFVFYFFFGCPLLRFFA